MSQPGARTAFASLGAPGVPPFLLAASAAGSSAFFLKLRPCLMAVAVRSVAFGLYQSWRAQQCQRKPGVLSTVRLWCSAAVVFASLFFPQAMANLLAGYGMTRGKTCTRFAVPALLGFAILYYLYGNLGSLKDSFNASAGSVRLVVMLSPTWAVCLQGASALEKALQQETAPNLRGVGAGAAADRFRSALLR